MTTISQQPLVERLIELVSQKAKRMQTAAPKYKEDFQSLDLQLARLNGLVKRTTSSSDLLLRIQDIVWDAEDVLDEWEEEEAPAQKYCWPRINPSRLDERIKDRVDGMKRFVNSEGNVPPEPVASVSDHESPPRWRSAVEPVGMDNKIKEIIKRIEDPCNRVIAIIGMAGLGKTLVLQQVFKKIKGKYENSIWFSVSQCGFSTKALQLIMGENLGLHDLDKTVDAATKISDRLGDAKTRSLIVLDDADEWKAEDSLENLMEQIGLPDHSSCKIIMTSKSRDVAEMLGAYSIEMKPLSAADGYKLFCKYAFPDTEDNKPEKHLEDLSCKVAKACLGVPLVIKAVGGAMADIREFRDETQGRWNVTKFTDEWQGGWALERWRDKLRQLQEITKGIDYPNEEVVMRILKLCYDCLPAKLKPCYLYLSLFPEDQEIDGEYVMNAWIGEGFIPNRESESEELDVGNNYLARLFNLGLIEMGQISVDNPLKKFGKLHYLLRKLCLCASKNQRLLIAKDENPPTNADNSLRRISFVRKDMKELHKEKLPSALRTLLVCFKPILQTLPSTAFSNLSVLRVLDLSNTSIEDLPSVRHMKLLRVLNLRDTRLKRLPGSIQHLWRSLQFLDVSKGESSLQNPVDLPSWIGRFSSMHYLNLDRGSPSTLPETVSKLTCLQTLRAGSIVVSSQNCQSLTIPGLAKLTRLREVSLEFPDVSEFGSLEVLSALDEMRSLILKNKTRCSARPPQLPKALTAMKKLEFLYLEKFEVPSWLCDLKKLLVLRLEQCYGRQYPPLQELQELRELSLIGNRLCRTLPTGFGDPKGFPSLELLKIVDFPILEELPKLEKGGMKQLLKLYVNNCPSMKKNPVGYELFTLPMYEGRSKFLQWSIHLP